MDCDYHFLSVNIDRLAKVPHALAVGGTVGDGQRDFMALYIPRAL